MIDNISNLLDLGKSGWNGGGNSNSRKGETDKTSDERETWIVGTDECSWIKCFCLLYNGHYSLVL